MSEYWKSTPKYWCKHCKAYVRDTKLERTNHEATPKHQGNIKRFIRDLHRGHEREERDQQRAKDEVNRLNGVVSGSSSRATEGNAPPWKRKTAIPAASSNAQQATPAERKQQLSQLAAMGVAVPDDFRKEMAMAGDWQIVSERPVYDTIKQEGDSNDTKPYDADDKPEALNKGVRKRKHEGQDEEEEAGERVVRKGWGSTTRTYPGDVDLDVLLNGTKMKQRQSIHEGTASPATNDPLAKDEGLNSTTKTDSAHSTPLIKKEESDHNNDVPDPATLVNTSAKQEEEPAAGFVFKKRKPKQIWQN